jgi:hypothetical protein
MLPAPMNASLAPLSVIGASVAGLLIFAQLFDGVAHQMQDALVCRIGLELLE